MRPFLRAGVAGLLLCADAARADLDLSIEAGGGYSDNIQRVDGDEVDEKIGTLGVDLLWLERTRRLDGNASVDVSYFEYFDDTFDSEVVGTGDGALTVKILPERFTWLFQDSFGQAQSDPFAPATPETREDLNYFTTGPDLIMRMGSASSVRLFGRYSATSYEESPLDAKRRSVGLAVAREPSQRSEIALNGVTEKVDFDEPGSGDYDRKNAFLSYRLDGARTDLNTEFGYTWLEPDDGDRSGGLLANISLTRDLSSSSTLHLEVGTQFTDAGDALRGALEGGGAVGGADITASADPFENRSASLSWSFARNRTGFTLGASWNQDRYEQQTLLDHTRFAYEAVFTRRLSPTLDFDFSVSLNDEEFDNRDLQADELNLGARLSWNPGRTIGLALSAERFDRNTSNGLAEYVENRVFLTITYRPVRAPVVMGAP
jgi:hypothetical protein